MNDHILKIFKEAITTGNLEILINQLNIQERKSVLNCLNDGEYLESIGLFDEIEKLGTKLFYYFYTEEEAVEQISDIGSLDIFNQCAVILKLPTDDMKLSCLEKVDDEIKNVLIASLQDDNKKIPYLNSIEDEWSIQYILKSMSSDQIKLQFLDKLPDEDAITNIVSSLSDNNLKLQNLDKILQEKNIATILASLSDDNLKLQNLDRLFSDINVATVLASLSDDNLKLQNLDKLQNEGDLSTVISSFHDDNLKFQYLSRFQDDSNLCHVVYSIKSPLIRLQCFDILDDDLVKYRLVLGFESDFVEKNLFRIIDSIKNVAYKFRTLCDGVKNETTVNEGLKRIDLFKDDTPEVEMQKKKRIYSELKKLSSFAIIKSFGEYISKNAKQITYDNIKIIIKILYKFEYSNSLELSSFKETLVPLIINQDDPLKAYEKIENLFLKNNIPMFGKVFLCFKILYPELKEFDFKNDKISPLLANPTQSSQMAVVNKNASLNDIRFQIIFNDLLRIAMRSYNRALREYISNIEYGNKLFWGVKNGLINYNDLDNKSRKVLDAFLQHLEALWERISKSEFSLKDLSFKEKLEFFCQKFKPTKKYELPDRIIRMVAYQAGISNFQQFKDIMNNSIKEREQISKDRSNALSSGEKFQLKSGDFIRGIGEIGAIESILNNGNVCNEYLGTFTGTSYSDATPLDTDWSLITKDAENIYEQVSETVTGFGFGAIYYVIKSDNPNMKITRNSEGEIIDATYEPDKIEMFRTCSSDHFGARTGVATSDVDYILINERVLSEQDISILKNEIVKNGFYIPVVDMSGSLVFSAADYDKLKEKMCGLSYYGSNEYFLSEHEESKYVNDIKTMLSSNEKLTGEKSRLVYQAIKNAIEDIIIDEQGNRMIARDKIGDDIVPGSIEVLETGSSVRGTNVPFDYDYDYVFRLDAEWLYDSEKNTYLINQICKGLNINGVSGGDIRGAIATIPGIGEVKLDITFVKKNDKVDYSTDMALQDRLDTIKNISPAMRDEVVANIILAKLLLKKAGCYSHKRKSELQGGLGGVGVENWILQNGGTLESAAKSFIQAANGKTFDEFKKEYHIHDYGKNHMYEKNNVYPYDEFVSGNMNAEGYKKMCDVLQRYLLYVNGLGTLPEIETAINELKSEMMQYDSEYLMANSEEKKNSFNKGYVIFGVTFIISFLMTTITIVICLLQNH